MARILLNPKEASEYLGVKESTMAVWRCKKTYSIPYIKVGGLIRYEKKDLDKWIKTRIRRFRGCNEQ